MSKHMDVYDHPLLGAAGFTPGISSNIMWKGNWQVHLDGDKMFFIEHHDDYRRKPAVQFTRQEFGRMFM